MTLPDSVSSKEVEFEKMLWINVEVLEILVGRSIRGNKKLEVSVSIKLLIESESSYFNKSISKSPNKKILLEDSFCSFNSNGEIKSLLKWFIWSVGCLDMQPTVTLVAFEQIISIKVSIIMNSLIGKSFIYIK